MTEELEKSWDPCNVVDSDSAAAVIVLNQPIENIRLFQKLCSKASYIIAADGGANRLKDLEQHIPQDEYITPTHIIGDLDSIRDEVRRYYETRGTVVLREVDQYSTDFTKCLKFLHKTRSAHAGKVPPFESTVIFGGLGGRADHAFAQIHQICMAAVDPDLRCGNLYLLTPESIIFVLEKGTNVIKTPVPLSITENVGIIPIGTPAVITTKGLEWDVEDWHTSFDGLMSTSNHIKAPEVVVTASERVLFTMELADKR